jgi:hypothetical protein
VNDAPPGSPAFKAYVAANMHALGVFGLVVAAACALTLVTGFRSGRFLFISRYSWPPIQMPYRAADPVGFWAAAVVRGFMVIAGLVVAVIGLLNV